MSEQSAEPSWVQVPPAPFDIVATFFPEAESNDKPGPKLRPGLVLSVLNKPGTNQYACKIAFGTKKLKIVQRQGLDIIVQNAEDIAQFGLVCATRFDLDLIAMLPWNPEFFECWSGYQHPVIGSLNEPYIKEYAYLMMKRQTV